VILRFFYSINKALLLKRLQKLLLEIPSNVQRFLLSFDSHSMHLKSLHPRNIILY
jgi:hypothetical protein